MTEQEILCTMALTRVPHVNTAMQRRLLDEAGSATAVFEYRRNIRDLYPEASDKLLAALANMEQQLPRAEEELQFAREHGIRCLCLHDTDFPSRLRECDDAPVLLYYKGNADLNRARVVSMVGTRHATEYGKDICRHFVAELKRLCPDTLVVSGLAYGIDIHSHRDALDNGMDTVGVLAHGLDQIYPRMHRDTAVLMTSHGGLLTEFMSRTNADKVNFVRRNRIVAGMADATLLVESAERGGGLITTSIAQSYGREVFAFPGAVGMAYSEGCNRLIRDNGAALITCAADLAASMAWDSDQALLHARQQGIERQLFPELTGDERLIVATLAKTNDMQTNMLAARSGIPVQRMSALLFSLEMKGVVKMYAGGIYHLLQ